MFELNLPFPPPMRILCPSSKAAAAQLALGSMLQQDFATYCDRAPSLRLEVLCCSPGLHALALHRLAHWLHQRKVAFFPRLLSHLGRFLTGIEIHPGATIGSGLVIESGMGIVIGETAIIGNHCWLESEVTLGGTGKESGKRHPTLGNHVRVGTGAKVLGNITIGDRTCITAGAVVLRDLPSDCTVGGVPARTLAEREAEEGETLRLFGRIEQLEQQIQKLQQPHPHNYV